MKSLFKISLAILLSLLTLNLAKADSIYLGAGGGYSIKSQLDGVKYGETYKEDLKFSKQGAINIMLGYTLAAVGNPIALDLGFEYDIYLKEDIKFKDSKDGITYSTHAVYFTPGLSIFLKDGEVSSIFIKGGFGTNMPVMSYNVFTDSSGTLNKYKVTLDSKFAFKIKAGYEHVFAGKHAISLAYSYASLAITAKSFNDAAGKVVNLNAKSANNRQEVNVAYRYKFNLASPVVAKTGKFWGLF